MDSELALHRSCCRSSKQDGSVSSGTWHVWAIRKTRPDWVPDPPRESVDVGVEPLAKTRSMVLPLREYGRG